MTLRTNCGSPDPGNTLANTIGLYCASKFLVRMSAARIDTGGHKIIFTRLAKRCDDYAGHNFLCARWNMIAIKTASATITNATGIINGDNPNVKARLGVKTNKNINRITPNS